MKNKKTKKAKNSKALAISLKLLYYLVISFVCLIALFLVNYILTSQVHKNDKNYKPDVSIYTIVSPSMTPVINVYDVVVNVRPESPEDIQIGDIITYKSTAPTSEGMTITHRVIAIDQLPDGTYEYMTQGDNNAEPDSVYVTYDNVIGKEIITIPKVGYLQFLLANQKGWLFLLLIPIGIYLIKELFKLIDLLGLRKRVEKIMGPKEETIIISDPEKEEQLKEELKEKRRISEARKESYIRSEYEQNGFLEKYQETIIKVKSNKYQENKKYPKDIKIDTSDDEVFIPTPTKVTVKELKPKVENMIGIDLPKVKNKPLVVNEHYEILDTDELSTKIKEYDSKIEKLDKMIKDIESINPEVLEEPETIPEIDDFLQGTKIKVIKIEETKNKKSKKVSSKSDITKKELIKKDININIASMIPLSDVHQPVAEKPKASKTKKKELNLNPQSVKKVNRPNRRRVAPKKKNNKTNKEKLIIISKQK